MSILNDDIDYEPLYEAFITILKEKYFIEIEQNDIQWRGFGSQGDGLSFDFRIDGSDVVKFLEAISAPHNENFKKFWNVDYIYSCGIETVKNTFATCYCHSQTRNISFWFENYEPDVTQYCKDMNQIKEDLKKIEDHIRNWYISLCGSWYDALSEHYEESCAGFPDFPDEEEEQWGVTITHDGNINATQIIGPFNNELEAKVFADIWNQRRDQFIEKTIEENPDNENLEFPYLKANPTKIEISEKNQSIVDEMISTIEAGINKIQNED